MDNYSKSIKELSNSEFQNYVINSDIKMISLDDVADDFNKFNNDFTDKFSSADALYILEKEDKIQLFFFEFKNLDYSLIKDRQMSKFYLNKCIDEMHSCEHDCKIYNEIKKHAEKLVDVSQASLRSKPADSISLVYHIMENYFKTKGMDINCIEKMFNIEKFFFLVSKTQSQYIPFKKNINNRYSDMIKPLSFLKRFEPYHYKFVFAVNENGFNF